jgi:serine/threonine protein kinase
MHVKSKGYSHLDIKCENILVDHNLVAKLGDFDFCQIYAKGISMVTGSEFHKAPEICYRKFPYDGEKADVFASAFILLAIFALDNFSSNGREQVRSEAYEYFKQTGHLRDYWRSKRLTPSQELQDLFAGML